MAKKKTTKVAQLAVAAGVPLLLLAGVVPLGFALAERDASVTEINQSTTQMVDEKRDIQEEMSADTLELDRVLNEIDDRREALNEDLGWDK